MDQLHITYPNNPSHVTTHQAHVGPNPCNEIISTLFSFSAQAKPDITLANKSQHTSPPEFTTLLSPFYIPLTHQPSSSTAQPTSFPYTQQKLDAN